MRWVKRNEDKTHRCPECHAVAAWERESAGPKTIFKCPYDCAVQWRYGRRWQKRSMDFKQLLEGGYVDRLQWYTVQRFGCLTRAKK